VRKKVGKKARSEGEVEVETWWELKAKRNMEVEKRSRLGNRSERWKRNWVEKWKTKLEGKWK
jgi:hypothetical protein